MSIEADDVDRMDERVPPRIEGQQQIIDYLQENTGGQVGDRFAEEVGKRLAKTREAAEEKGLNDATPGDAYYDPEAGAWRDSETGQFTDPSQ